MNCPVCKTNLVISDRQGIEIDYCPNCRGVWLDRGELDKLIERAPGTSFSPTQQQNFSQPFQDHPQQFSPSSQQQQSQHYYDDDDDRYRYQNQHSHQHKKKESWLGEIFDF
jgi:Zn-finger nucleic acid-binding protein